MMLHLGNFPAPARCDFPGLSYRYSKPLKTTVVEVHLSSSPDEYRVSAVGIPRITDGFFRKLQRVAESHCSTIGSPSWGRIESPYGN